MDKLNAIKKHDTAISVVKGICIILMVLGHTNCPQWLWRFIYLFHMPCFFLVSGYFLTDNAIRNWGRTIIRRIKGLWWPFVKWTVAFILLHNVLYGLHICDDAYTLETILFRSWDSVFFNVYEVLLGQFWFLEILFWTSILVLVAFKVLKIIFPNKEQSTFILPLIAVIISCAYIKHNLHLDFIPPQSTSLAMAMIFYLSGLYIRLNSIVEKGSALLGAGLLCAVGVISVWYSQTIGKAGNDMLLYYLVGMAGSLGLIYVAKGMRQDAIWVTALDYLGTCTLSIFIFHHLAFKIFSYIHIILYDLSIEDMANLPVPKNDSLVLSIIYTVFGVCIPLAINYIVIYIKKFTRPRHI